MKRPKKKKVEHAESAKVMQRYLPKRASKKTDTKRRKRKITIFKKSHKGSQPKRKKKRSLGRGVQFIFKIFIILTLPVILGFSIFKGIEEVIKIRSTPTETVNGTSAERNNIIGFDLLPIYPDSEFVFKNNLENDDVRKFLTNGEAIYRIPAGDDYEEVLEYYNKTLPEYGWEHVLSVSRISTTQEYGEYWIHIEKDLGIKISSEFNDIWYQKLTVLEAETGLLEKVRKENEREIIIAESDQVSFLPDFPWVLEMPREYILDYYQTDYEDYRGVKISSIDSSESVYIQPLGPNTGEPLDAYLHSFISTLHNEQEEPISKYNFEVSDEFGVVNSAYTEISGRTYLQSTLSGSGESGIAYSTMNNRSTYYYAIFRIGDSGEIENSNEESDSTILDFVLENISEKNSSYVQEDFEF